MAPVKYAGRFFDKRDARQTNSHLGKHSRSSLVGEYEHSCVFRHGALRVSRTPPATPSHLWTTDETKWELLLKADLYVTRFIFFTLMYIKKKNLRKSSFNPLNFPPFSLHTQMQTHSITKKPLHHKIRSVCTV